MLITWPKLNKESTSSGQSARSHKQSLSSLQRRKGGKGGGSKGRGGKKSSGSGGKTKTTGKSSTGGSTSRPRFRLPGIGNRGATPFANGGGSIARIPSGTTFGGRSIGGGTRSQVFGTSKYGSGYPYDGYGTYVGGRGFPFGFWPVYWGPRYYGGDEYGPERNNSRPGGNLTTTRLQSTFWKNISSTLYSRDDTTPTLAIHPFNLVGDEDSVRAVLDVLVTSNCYVANLTVVPLDLTNTSQPQPENVIQYYRSSSLALTLDGYINNVSSRVNMPGSNWTAVPDIQDTPIPRNSTDLTFLACINATIGEALPVLDSGAIVRFGSVSDLYMGSLMGLLWIAVFVLRGYT
ncbi:hypothetical protein DL93DRAFT_2154621 [Clavulina sp. PMI_390]|nr:hypothetical protein DL93DRAFT_2154621 [Clavulina sp. PMI_390]